ncbi:uncharacterized protein LOC133302537 [Gastrolobium bilobum]|uniref:uncharacterized protein LOC133302537 n=1 Tax=Gastrolobium bilobum TaxID=150636 RepID=UPI002AAF97AB|nr:uncharacterized protein LOC133302537 [Gastrolobium bilobum]
MCQSVNFALNNNNATVEMLTGSNYKKWKQDIEFALGIVDLDFALRQNEPRRPTDESTDSQRAHYARWEKSNRLSLIAMKRSIAEHLLSGLPENLTAKAFLDAVGERFKISNKAEAGYLVNELTNMKYNASIGIREFILRMVHIQTKLKGHNIVFQDDFIVHHVLNVLPADFSQIKTAYTAQNETWGVNDLIGKCVAEEDKLKKEKNESAFALLSIKDKTKFFNKNKGKFKRHNSLAPKQSQNFKRKGNDDKY